MPLFHASYIHLRAVGKENPSMIELSGVCVRYGAEAILTDCSLLVHPGEIVALVGENGCGKSTLGRVLCAAQLVDAGSVSVDGHDPRVSELERLRVRDRKSVV